MKSLLLRLRHWLIRKLGGYTEQKVMPQLRYYPMFSTLLKPERVVVNMRLSYRELLFLATEGDKEKFLADRAKDVLVEEMVRKIIEEEYAVLSCEPDMAYGAGGRVYSMAICVVRPNEWLKTCLGEIVDPIVLRGEQKQTGRNYA